ncbi:MAG: DUF4203 domain-containing protein [Vicinamibacterales bacterium]
MLPGQLHVPVAVVLLAAGIVAAFWGYRLFRLTLGIYGFILGAVAAVSLIDANSTVMLVALLVGGGLAGAAVFVLAYFAAVALLGGASGVLFAQSLWPEIAHAQASIWVLILFAAIGVVSGLVFQRYVVVLVTAFGGAWTAVVAALALAGGRGGGALAEVGRVWVLYPLHPGPARPFILGGWFLLGLLGVAVQLGLTAGRRRRK